MIETPVTEAQRYDICPNCKHSWHSVVCNAMYVINDQNLEPVIRKCLCTTMSVTNDNSEGAKSYRVPIAWRFDLIPPIFIRRLAAIFEEGAQKYGESQYMVRPLPFSVIMNHMMNHLLLYWSGDKQEDHLAKVAWGIAAMMALEECKADFNNDLTNYGIRAGKKDG